MDYQSIESSQYFRGKINFNNIYSIESENSQEQNSISFKFQDEFRDNAEYNTYDSQIDNPPLSLSTSTQLKQRGKDNQINYIQGSSSNENESSNQNEERKKLKFTKYFSEFVKQSKLISSSKKFYLFLDQVFDFEYFSNYSNKENYLKERQTVQWQKNMRFINKLTHRQDNKFIEIDMEFFPSTVNDIEYIVSTLLSYGNKDLLNFIKCIQMFWEQIKICKQQIIQQYEDPLFQQHFERRKQASRERFDKITQECSQTRLVFYLKITINYEKQLFDSDIAGYSPGLYEILDKNSYSFKNYLQTYGYFDPRTNIYKLEQCFNGVLETLPIITQKNTFSHSNYFTNIEQEIRTIDGFIFPVSASGQLYNLDFDYDQQNNLNLFIKDFLLVIDFSFLDPCIYEDFKIYREQQQYQQSKPVTIYDDNDEFFTEQIDYKKTEFFKKYYEDQIDNLIAKGSKWFKRCGYADIPIKKKRKMIEETDSSELNNNQ